MRAIFFHLFPGSGLGTSVQGIPYPGMSLGAGSKTVLVLIFLVIISAEIFSQQEQSMKLTLQECIGMAQTNSVAAKIARNNIESHVLAYKSFRSGFLPALRLYGSAPGLIRGINPVLQNDGTTKYLPQSQLTSSANLAIEQKIPYTGGSLSLSSGLNRFDLLGTNSSTFFWRSSPIQVSLSQPIFQYNSMMWDMEIEEIRTIYYDKQYTEAMEDIAADVTQKFFDTYIARMNLRNAELNVAINDTLFLLSKGRYDVGKIAENDLLQSELQLMNVKNDKEYARLDFQRATEDLRIAIGIESNGKLSIIPPADMPLFNVDTARAIEKAMQNRSDIINYTIEEKQSIRNIIMVESRNRFNATISASYGLNQSAGAVPDAYRNLLDQESLDLNITIPLFQWGKATAEIESAYLDQKRIESTHELQKQNFELDVKYSVLRFEQYQKQVAISGKTDTIASRRFEVAKNRYMIGKIDLNSLFIAQNEKDNAMKSYIQTLRNYWIAYYRLRRMTLYDFRKDEPIHYEVKG